MLLSGMIMKVLDPADSLPSCGSRCPLFSSPSASRMEVVEGEQCGDCSRTAPEGGVEKVHFGSGDAEGRGPSSKLADQAAVFLSEPLPEVETKIRECMTRFQLRRAEMTEKEIGGRVPEAFSSHMA